MTIRMKRIPKSKKKFEDGKYVLLYGQFFEGKEDWNSPEFVIGFYETEENTWPGCTRWRGIARYSWDDDTASDFYPTHYCLLPDMKD